MSALRLSPGRDTTDLKAQKCNLWVDLGLVFFECTSRIHRTRTWFHGLVSLRSSLSSPDASLGSIDVHTANIHPIYVLYDREAGGLQIHKLFLPTARKPAQRSCVSFSLCYFLGVGGGVGWG